MSLWKNRMMEEIILKMQTQSLTQSARNCSSRAEGFFTMALGMLCSRDISRGCLRFFYTQISPLDVFRKSEFSVCQLGFFSATKSIV